MQKLILLVGLCVFNTGPGVSASQNLMCHFDSLSQERHADAHFSISDIDANLCTHLIYGSVTIGSSGGLDILPSDISSFSDFNDLKNSNSELKTLLEINLLNNIPGLLNMISTEQNQNSFIQSTISAVQAHGFDGMNILWMYRPNYPGMTPQQFSELIKDLRLASSGLLLSASISHKPFIIDNSYEIPTLSANVDFLNILSAGIDINFLSNPSNTAFQTTKSSIQHLISEGAEIGKLNMGIAAFGRAYATLSSSQSNQPDLSQPLMGYFGDNQGFFSHFEVCLHNSLTPSTGQIRNAWLGYDSIPIIISKAEYIINNQLGGAFLMSIDQDDFSGEFCDEGNYPILQTLHNELISEN
uniref:acidic mammalian chitinase-like n=1 Tax=Doryrhamphus excisus TaxID=161450 RepID=UPI0025AEAF0E|nr:acidic mammalian chitinase-like [Doryrhamphus excisus]